MKKKVVKPNTNEMRIVGFLNEAHAENLKTIKEGIDMLNTRFNKTEKILNLHTEILGELKTEKIDRDEFEALSRRVSVLETRVRK